MSLWFLDASVVLASEDADDVNHGDATRLLRGGNPLATLDLAYFEVTDVALRSWQDRSAAHRLCERITAVAADGGLVRVEAMLIESTAAIAEEHGISGYDAAYVAASRVSGGQLVSCDLRDLVSRGLAVLPGDAVGGETRSSSHPSGT